MPVVTVAEAAQLATAGRLDGRDVAVAGWFFELMPSCPYPGRYVADLEGFCHFVLFTDTEGAADACDETSCSWNGNGPLTPFILSDTLGDWRELSQPVPMVAIGHAGDARALHCTPDDEAACADQFVVDRVAWAGDKLLDATPRSFAYPGYEGLTTSLTLADISTLLGGSEQVVSAVAVTADGVRSFDPRWNSVGSQPQWIVRSVPSGSDASDVARPVTVWLIDDASGRVVDSQPETLTRQDSGRLWLTQTVHNGDENGSDVRAFYDVIGPDGVAVVWDGPMASSFGYKGSRTFGPDIPVLVPPGDYTLRAWLERFDRQTGDPIANEQPIGTCSTQLSVEAGDDVMFNAAYRSAPCIWSSTTAELTFGYP